MYGENKDCPIRITSIIGFSKATVEEASDKLIKEFGWKHHSWADVTQVVYPGVHIHSRILFHTGETETVTCPRCYGEGPSADCALCKGSGTIRRSECQKTS